MIETAAGEEAQVDYGTGPMVRDPHSGKYRRTRLFVLTLGYSRKSVRLLVFHSSTQTWAELHEKAFRRLGGVHARSCSTTFARACSSPTSTIPRSTLCTATCCGTTASSPCPAGWPTRIARGRWRAASAMRRRPR